MTKELRKILHGVANFFGHLFFGLVRLTGQREELAKHLVGRILIIKLAGIGDVLQTTPLLRALREYYPDAKISWLSESWTKQVLEENPHVDEVMIYDVPWRGRRRRGRLAGVIRLVRDLRGHRFHMAVIPHRSPLGGWLTWAAGIPYRVGFDSEDKGYALTNRVPYDPAKPEIERNLDLLLPLGLAHSGMDMELYYSPEDEALASAFLLQNGIGAEDRVIGLGPGGAANPGMEMHHKRWPKQRFAEVGEALARSEWANVVIFGSTDDEPLAQEVAATIAVKVVVAAGKTDLRQTAAMLARCAIYIGNDSGPLYVAAAVGTPTVGIFGPTDPRLLKPPGESHVAVWKGLDCSPCFHPMAVYDVDVSKCDTQACMTEIAADEVYEAARGLLRSVREAKASEESG